MGATYGFTAIVGVKIDVSSAYYTKEAVTIDTRCKHAKKLNPQPLYCPQCGKKIEEPRQEDVRAGREDLLEALGLDMTETWNDEPIIDWVNTSKDDLPFEFVLHHSQGENVWCGTCIAGGWSDDPWSFDGELRQVPNREALFEFLDGLGLKYEKEYGLWTISEGQ